MKRKQAAFDELPLRLFVFAPYQRQVITAKINRLVREWRLDAIGVITVSIRDGKAYVVDGQHRIRAALESGLSPDTKVPCHVFRYLTEEEEARKFLELNDANAIKATDRYKAGLIANDPIAMGVRDVLDKHGLAISSTRTDGYVRCVTEVYKLYETDPVLLDEVCAVLVESWGTRVAALERLSFAAMGAVLGRFNGEIDRGTLVKKLAKYRGGPAALAGDARGLADYKPISITRAAAEIIVDAYNRGRRAGVLSPL